MKLQNIERLELAAELLLDFIIDWKVNNNEVFIPEAWKNYLGYTDAEIDNNMEGWMKTANPLFIPDIEKIFENLINGSKEIITTELEVLHKNGKSSWITSKAKVVAFNSNGSASRIIVAFHEIESRKKIEIELYKSEKRFNNLFNNHASVMLIIDPENGDIITANSAAEKFYGYSLKYLQSIKITDINGLPPLETLKAMEAVVKQHQGVYIFQHKLSSGNIKFVEVHSTAIEDNNKTVLFSIVNDIDDKIRTENLLKEEKDNLNAILATFPDIIFKLDNENKFLYCHTNDADNLLMPTDEFLGKHITDVLPDTISLLLIEKIETAKQTGDLQEIIYSINIPNKGAVWYEARIVVFKQSGTIILARDITTKVNSNKQLMLLESAIANVADSIIITEAETINQPGPKIVFVNDAFVKNTGYTRKEVIGKTPRILQGKNSDRKELDRLRNAMEHRAPCEIEIINYKKNGEEYWVQISLVPMADENGDITNWVATQKDITDKKKIDAQLNTLSKVIEQSPASIMITDINANIEYVNTAFTNISGYTPEEVIGKNAKILKTEHTLPEQHKSLVKALKRKEIWHGEFINKSKDGKLYWGQVVISPVFNNQGELIHFVSVNENVTQRKIIENRLKEKINILEAGHTVSNVGYFIGYFNQDKDLDMKSFVNWNASANLYDILNINSTFKGDILENWLKLFHVDDIDKGINHCADAILKNKNIDIKMRTKGTTEADVRWLKFNGKVEYNNAGRPMVLILYIEDITNLETLVRDRGLIIESITDYFYVVDEHFNFIYYNKKYGEKYLKVNGDECIGKNFHDLFPGAVETEFLAYFKQAMETKELVKCDFMVTEMGEYNGWFEQSFYPFASGCSVLFRDISARKNSEKELLLLNEQLKISSKELINTNIELERFAYVASHDLQEPLRMVSSFIQLFEKKYSDTVDDTGKQYIRFAVDGAERMKTLIRDLLQYSRAGSGPLEIIDVDMNEVMKEVQMIFRNETINMHVDIIIQHLPVIRANTSTMLQLMQNLVGNAIKYNDKERPIIKVSGSENDTEWIISVKDNGIGIDPEFSDKIFVIFKRLHAKDKYSGTGIGLSVCQKIVEKYKGKIWVKSQVGNGSEFIFTIPKSTM